MYVLAWQDQTHRECMYRHLRFRDRRSHDAVIRVYDDAGNVIETHEHKGDFREP